MGYFLKLGEDYYLGEQERVVSEGKPFIFQSCIDCLAWLDENRDTLALQGIDPDEAYPVKLQKVKELTLERR